MCKLLSANFMRLKKDKVFWSVLLFMVVWGIVFPVMLYREGVQTGNIGSIDALFGQYAMDIGIVMAVFCSFFVGTEYSDGTIRNKIISGKKRTDIYLANFITCAVVSMIICGVFFLVSLCIGIPLLDFFTVDRKVVLLFVLTVIALSIAFCSIYHMIAMLIGNKAVITAICMILAFLLLVLGIKLTQMINAPKNISGVTMTETGPKMEEFPNPSYLNDEERQIVQFFYDFTPAGQVGQCVTMNAVNLPMLPVYSLVIVLSTTAIGSYCFKKKELK